VDLAFIIIFGTRWHFKPIVDGWTGTLSCPGCQRDQHFVEMEAFKAFTVYWFPLFRTEHAGRLVECSVCDGKFERPEAIFGTVPGDRFLVGMAD
jgi:hypothetical protein